MTREYRVLLGCLYIRRIGIRADGVKVALVKLAVATSLGIFTSPHGPDLIAFKGEATTAVHAALQNEQRAPLGQNAGLHRVRRGR